MSKRIAILSIIVEDSSATEKVNSILHEYRECVIGRMGIPYREKNVSIISVALDEETEKINSLTGKLGMIKGISAKTLFSKV